MDQHAGRTVTHWLLCDYGNVLSTPQPPGDVARLADMTGLALEEFTQRYWADRLAYDLADLDKTAYWSRVLRHPIDGEPLAELVSADIASWSHLNAAAVAAATQAADRGFQLALLSNAPTEVARAIEQLEALAPFSPRWFSCDLRMAKPDPAIYKHVLAGLHAPGSAVTFIDDRPENVAAATTVGLRAVVFEDSSQIDDL